MEPLDLFHLLDLLCSLCRALILLLPAFVGDICIIVLCSIRKPIFMLALVAGLSSACLCLILALVILLTENKLYCADIATY